MTELITLHDNTVADGFCVPTPYPILEMRVSCSKTRARRLNGTGVGCDSDSRFALPTCYLPFPHAILCLRGRVRAPNCITRLLCPLAPCWFWSMESTTRRLKDRRRALLGWFCPLPSTPWAINFGCIFIPPGPQPLCGQHSSIGSSSLWAPETLLCPLAPSALEC